MFFINTKVMESHFALWTSVTITLRTVSIFDVYPQILQSFKFHDTLRTFIRFFISVGQFVHFSMPFSFEFLATNAAWFRFFCVISDTMTP